MIGSRKEIVTNVCGSEYLDGRMSRPPELAEALALVLTFEHPNVNFAKLGTIFRTVVNMQYKKRRPKSP